MSKLNGLKLKKKPQKTLLKGGIVSFYSSFLSVRCLLFFIYDAFDIEAKVHSSLKCDLMLSS